MKKSELRKLIKEEIKSHLIREDMFDKFIDKLFGKAKASQKKAALKSLSTDPEYQKLKKKMEQNFIEAEEFLARVKATKDSGEGILQI